MKPQTAKVSALLPTIVGIVLVLIGAAVGARMMGLLPNSIGAFGGMRNIELVSDAAAESGTSVRLPGNGRVRRRCPECGVIASVRAIDSNASNPASNLYAGGGGVQGIATNRYEVIVRLDGGARRVMVDTNPTRWREGERVIVIDGTIPSQR